MSRYKKFFAFVLCLLVVSLFLSGCTTNQYARRMATPNDLNRDLTGTNRGNNDLDNTGLGGNNMGQRNNWPNNFWGNVDYNHRVTSITEKADISFGRIKIPSLDIRSGPGSNYNKIGTVKSNQKLNVYGKAGNWYIVQVPGKNDIGCVESRYVEPYPSGTTGKKQIPNIKPPVTNGNNTGNIGIGNDMTPGVGTNRPGTTTPGAGGGTTTPGAGGGTTTPGTGGGTTTPGEDAAGTGVMTAEEKRILELCNAERAKVGAPALKANNDLTKLARMKSKDMVDKGYFSHQSPTYGSPFDMLRNYGVSYMYAGENLAQNTTAEKAFRAWMNSEGHRKNILNPNFTELGVGIASMDGSNMYTQLFIGK
ncbi:MAG: SH3 domain-containing protein [Clostridiales bacterium]|nr:SH3 domain-containing protein [Clostridiales bacterium]